MKRVKREEGGEGEAEERKRKTYTISNFLPIIMWNKQSSNTRMVSKHLNPFSVVIPLKKLF